jgi:transposase
MSRKFREWQPDASWLFPPSPRDWLPEDHLVYFLLDVTAQIDISPIVDDYSGKDGRTDGQPPFHPRMMLVLLLYAYSQGVFSSRKIMQRCTTDAAFRIIVVEDIPDFRRIAEFRVRHFAHMQPLFLQVLMLCREAGLLKVGRLSLDGTKVKPTKPKNSKGNGRHGPKRWAFSRGQSRRKRVRTRRNSSPSGSRIYSPMSVNNFLPLRISSL